VPGSVLEFVGNGDWLSCCERSSEVRLLAVHQHPDSAITTIPGNAISLHRDDWLSNIPGNAIAPIPIRLTPCPALSCQNLTNWHIVKSRTQIAFKRCAPELQNGIAR